MVTCSLVGGFKYFLFSPLFGEKIPILTHVFQLGGSTTGQKWFTLKSAWSLGWCHIMTPCQVGEKTQASWVDRCDIPSFARKKTQGSLTAGSPNKNPTSKRWQVKRAWSRQLHSPEVPGSLALDSLGDFFFWSENRGVSAGPPTPSGPRTRLFLVCKRDDGSELLKPWNHYSTPWKINMEPTNHPFR